MTRNYIVNSSFVGTINGNRYGSDPLCGVSDRIVYIDCVVYIEGNFENAGSYSGTFWEAYIEEGITEWNGCKIYPLSEAPKNNQ